MRDLEPLLMPLAVEVVDTSVAGLSPAEVKLLLTFLRTIRDNIDMNHAETTSSDED